MKKIGVHEVARDRRANHEPACALARRSRAWLVRPSDRAVPASHFCSMLFCVLHVGIDKSVCRTVMEESRVCSITHKHDIVVPSIISAIGGPRASERPERTRSASAGRSAGASLRRAGRSCKQREARRWTLAGTWRLRLISRGGVGITYRGLMGDPARLVLDPILESSTV